MASRDEPLDYSPFTPRRTRVVLLTFAVLVMVAFVTLAVMFFLIDLQSYTVLDAAMLLILGALITVMLVLFGMVKAVPTEAGLFVRNILSRRTYEWAEIIAVRLVEQSGDPWVTLDLSDGTTAAVMAIQRSDGRHGSNEALRLALLVDAHSPTD